MKIKKLHIEGHTYLLNKGTHRIVWTPESPYQLLMGNNGYGKSTLMSEFSLLPAEGTLYTKQGYKEVIAQVDDIEYRAVSDFKQKHVHSFFIGDGPNLNEGGTITIQKLLIKEHLGYTPEIHDLVLGNVRLTELSANKRKEWFARISEVNVDFGLKLFSVLKTEARNVVGARKHVDGQIIKESAKLLTETEIQELKVTIDAIRLQIQELNRVREGFISAGDKARVKYLESELAQYTTDLESIDDIPNRIAVDFDSFKTECTEAATRVNTLQAQLDGLFREQELLNNVLKLLADEEQHPLEDLVQQRDALVKSLPAVSESLQSALSPYPLDTLDMMVRTLESLIDDVDDIYNGMYENPNGALYNGARLKALAEARDTTAEHVAHIERDLDRKVTRRNLLQSHDPVNCPSCDHTWVPGVSEVELAQLTAEIERLATELTAAQTAAVKAQSDLEHIQVYVQYRQALANLSAQYPVLKPYWRAAIEHPDLNDHPKQLTTFTRKYLKDLVTYVGYLKTEKQVTELTTAIDLRESKLKEAESVKQTTQTTELESNIYETTQALKAAQVVQGYYKTMYRRVTQAMAIGQKLEATLLEYYKEHRKLWDTEREECLKGVVDQLSADHYAKWTQLNELEAVTKVVEHLRTDLKDLDDQQVIYDALVKALSPTTGIIADTLVGFMNEFIGEMNNVISRIWTTKLELGPCSIKRDEFTYMFPVATEGESHPMADVSKGSTGEKDIFNFTFRLIAMQYMGLDTYPLLTDELGSSFRSDHKRRLYDYLKLLIDSGTCSQLIAISHFTDTVDELNRADVNVIDTTGLLVPPGANRVFDVS